MERRQYPRRYFQVPPGPDPLDNATSAEVYGEWLSRLRNLSLGGCMFYSPCQLNVEALVEIRMWIHGEIATADAAVVFSGSAGDSGYSTGVRFLGLPESDRRLIEYKLEGESDEEWLSATVATIRA